jgi:hypothetical protein
VDYLNASISKKLHKVDIYVITNISDYLWLTAMIIANDSTLCKYLDKVDSYTAVMAEEQETVHSKMVSDEFLMQCLHIKRVIMTRT